MKLIPKSVLERLVLKKHAECTSQRVKRTSGARDMINLGPRLVLFSFGLVAPTCFICVWPCWQQNSL